MKLIRLVAYLLAVVCSFLLPAAKAVVVPSCFRIIVQDSSIRYLQNGRVKLGIDLQLGGAVTYLSDTENGGENMINSYDWGRQIQMSYYSGPWPYLGPKGETPAAEWAGLGWNPIQSGDAGGHRSKILSFERIGDTAMFVRSIPMQWPHRSGIAGECVFETLYTLKDNIVTIRATIINDRADKTQYRAGSQEMPAVYTNGSWYQVVTYLGDKPFKDQPTTVLVDKGKNRGWPWIHFYTPENWVALLDRQGKGIGVFQPEVFTFNAGFHPDDQTKGYGGDKDFQTGHIAPIGTQILDHNINWTYTTSLILGDLKAIRMYAKAKWQNKTNPSWVFKTSRSNWYYAGDIEDEGFPLKDGLVVNFEKGAKLIGPITYWNAESARYLEIEGAMEGHNSQLELDIEIQPISKADFTDWLNWSDGESNVESERKAKAMQFPGQKPMHIRKVIKADGKMKVYKIDLKSTADYTGAMKRLNIKFSEKGKANIRRIQFAQ